MAFLFYTSPTSGTASLDRIVHRIGRPRPFVRVSSPVSLTPAEGRTYVDAGSDTIYWFQGPRFWNAEFDLTRFSTVAHFRDPRDLACNQYWWALQHPNRDDPPEIAEAKRRQIEARGIDAFLLERNYAEQYAPYRQIEAAAEAGAAVAYTSYTQLCCAFDYLVDSLCRVFDILPARVMEPLRIERPENLPGNKNWAKIGTVWQGSDINPGRFRGELTPETAKAATERFKAELAFCRRHEAPFLTVHYR